MTRKNNVVLDEFATFSKNLGTHQQQSMALLRGIKDSFDGSSKYTDLICNKVSEESEQVVSELSKIIKRSQESSTKQVNAIPQRISELEDCITTLLDKIVLTMTSSASASNNDHLIPEIVTKLPTWKPIWNKVERMMLITNLMFPTCYMIDSKS